MPFIENSRTKFTYEDYKQFPQDGKRHEIIDGEHHVTPAPETYHQTISRRLQFQLYRQIEEQGHGEIYNAPTDLQLSEVDVVQPDLIVVLAARKSIITPNRIKGTPDLVVEILSAATVTVDRGAKRGLYQKAGVPEYWIVSPDDHTVEQHVLEEGTYELRGPHTESLEFLGLGGIRVDLAKVW